jgi:D-hexose-6-phosphate mutarotase
MFMATTDPQPAAALNARFGLGPELVFRNGPQGLVFADIHNAQADAALCLQGAHLITWTPRTQSVPVIWVSDAVQYAPRKSIRGGVPVCWPWFGAHPAGGKLPSHGFARTVDWQVSACRRLEGGETQISFTLSDDAHTRELWPHAFALELRLSIGAQLRAELSTTNTGNTGFVLGEALHTYFRIGDIGDAQVLGLEGTEYVDSVNGARRARQQDAIGFSSEFDRVYLDAPPDLTIVDAILHRRIHITQTGARSAVVWNPWLDKATKMGDLGPGAKQQGGWREMLCVESANALDNTVALAPGATHQLAVQYRVSS